MEKTLRKICILSCIFIICYFCNSFSQTFPSGFNRINFECGGYVTKVVPAGINLLYARTDIGGVYKSTDNGNNWTFISQYARTPGGLMIQGLAVDPEDSLTVLIAVGNSANPSDIDNGIWKTTDGGASWLQASTEIIFGGNDFNAKIGGECLQFDKSNHPDSKWIAWAGGRDGKFYISIDKGSTWFDQATDEDFGDIATITMFYPDIKIPDWRHMFIGGSNGIWRSTDGGSGWTQILDNTESHGAVYTILIEPLTATTYNLYASIGINGSSSYGLIKSTNTGNNWINITSNFDISGLNYSGNYLVGLSLFKHLTGVTEPPDTSNFVFASRMANPTRMSTNSGANWNTINLPVDTNTLPNHFRFNGFEDNIFYSRNNFTQNSKDLNYFYCSGGAGPLRLTQGLGNTWEYITNGMSMTVVYDITFMSSNVQSDYQIYLPISDWTMGFTSYSNSQDFNKIDYARRKTLGPNPGDESYIANTRRVLLSEVSDRLYLIGGSIFSHEAAITKSTNGGITYSRISSGNNFTQSNTALLDGIITTNGSTDNIVVLYGASENSVFPTSSNDYGIYYSTNSGNSFTKASFAGSTGDDETSEDIFESSIIGGDSISGYLGSLFTPEFNLANSEIDTIKYLYLEGGNSPLGGGFFKSENGGINWSHISFVVPSGEYRYPGCIKTSNYKHSSGDDYNKVFIAIKEKGLYYSTNAGDSWINDSAFLSAEQVDAFYDSNEDKKIIVAFGKMNFDEYNKLYFSVDDGNSWSEFSEANYKIPSARALKININDPNEVWIGTGGEGVFVYSGLLSKKDRPVLLSHSDKYTLQQNYPNPFNPSTRIRYDLAKQGAVKLTVFDQLGRQVAELVNGTRNAGTYEVEFNGSNLASGIYFYMLDVEGQTFTKKMILVK